MPDNIYLDRMFLIICSLISYPFMLAENLHTIRYVCYIGFVTIHILLACIIYRALQLNTSQLFISKSILWPTSIMNIAHAIPIISFVFICQLNSLAIYSQLRHPSEKRINTITFASIAIITIIFLLFSFTGVLILHESNIITDNILLVFSIYDRLMLFGRVNLLITLICSLPILVVPARHLILDLFVAIRESPSLMAYDKSLIDPGKRIGKRMPSFDAETKGDITLPFSPLDLRNNAIPEDIDTPPSSTAGNAMILGYNDEVDLGMQGIEDTWRDYVVPSPLTTPVATIEEPIDHLLHENNFSEYGKAFVDKAISTGILTACALVTAIFIPRVQVVWGFVGSSVTIIIGFLTPSVCYLKLVASYHLNFDFYAVHACLMIAISVMLIGICNYVYFSDIQFF